MAHYVGFVAQRLVGIHGLESLWECSNATVMMRLMGAGIIALKNQMKLSF